LNDASTAILCIDRITVILVMAASRCERASHLREDGELCVITRPASFARLVQGAFATLYADAREQQSVMMRLLWSIERIATATSDRRRRAVLPQQALHIASHVADSRLLASERDRVLVAALCLHSTCRLSPVPSTAGPAAPRSTRVKARAECVRQRLECVELTPHDRLRRGPALDGEGPAHAAHRRTSQQHRHGHCVRSCVTQTTLHRSDPAEASLRDYARARWGNVALGTWLFASAFAWDHFALSQANTSIVGLLIFGTSLAALRHSRARWANSALAAWLFASTLFLIRPMRISTVWNNLLVAAVVLTLSLFSRGSGASPASVARGHRAD
jgi:predicted membrane protein DUF2254